jgi:hypothetical protein
MSTWYDLVSNSRNRDKNCVSSSCVDTSANYGALALATIFASPQRFHQAKIDIYHSGLLLRVPQNPAVDKFHRGDSVKIYSV